jgi:hypothetical protein
MTRRELYDLLTAQIIREEQQRRAARRAVEQERSREEARSVVARFVESVARVLRAVHRDGVYWPHDRSVFLAAPEEPSRRHRDEWRGVTGMGNEYPEPDHDKDWLGTMANPYRSPDDVGRTARMIRAET